MRITLAAILSTFLLSACNLGVSPDLYIGDLKAVANGFEPSVLTPATLVVEIPSCDDYEEYSKRVSDVAAGMLMEFRPKGCQDEGFKDYLRADVLIPVIGNLETWPAFGSIFGFLVAREGRNVAVIALIDLTRQWVLAERVREEFNQKLDFSESTITFVLNNDLPAPQAYVAKGVFVDSQPVVEPERFELAMRQSAEIVLSDVAVSRLARHGYVAAFTLQGGAQRPMPGSDDLDPPEL